MKVDPNIPERMGSYILQKPNWSWNDEGPIPDKVIATVNNHYRQRFEQRIQHLKDQIQSLEIQLTSLETERDNVEPNNPSN